MFQVFQTYVSSVPYFHLDVANVVMALPACFKHILQVFHMFHTYVTNISSRRCKISSGCCICCYAYTRMYHVFHLFQTYVANVSSGYFRSRLGCCTASIAGGQRLAAAACRCCWGRNRGSTHVDFPHAGVGTTTGFTLFAESQKRSAKPIRLSANALPRAALGKDLTAKLCPAKTPLPRANPITLGKEFVESQLSPR
jgi:hypothetical protein